MLDPPGLGAALAVSCSIFYSVTLVSLRQGLRSGSPAAALFLVNSLVGGFGLTVALLRGTLLISPPAFLLWATLEGLIGAGLGHITIYIGLQRLGASRTTPVAQSSPIWGIFMAVLLLGERPGLPVWIGTACAVSGVFLLSLAQDEAEEETGSWFQKEMLFPLAASVFSAIGPVFAKLALSHHQAPFATMGVAYTAGMAILLAGRSFLPGGGRLRADRRALGWFLLGTAFNIGASVSVMLALLVGEVSIVLPLSRLTPLGVLLLSFFFLGKVERITPRIVLAAALVVAGGVLITGFRG